VSLRLLVPVVWELTSADRLAEGELRGRGLRSYAESASEKIESSLSFTSIEL
jgi:hypothetical protein